MNSNNEHGSTNGSNLFKSSNIWIDPNIQNTFVIDSDDSCPKIFPYNVDVNAVTFPPDYIKGEIGYAIEKVGADYIARPIEIVDGTVRPGSWHSNVFDKNLIKFLYKHGTYRPLTKDEVSMIEIFSKIIPYPNINIYTQRYSNPNKCETTWQNHSAHRWNCDNPNIKFT